MKFTADRSYFHSAVTTAARAISNSNTLPVLANILIQTGADCLTFTGTDLDTAIITNIPATVHKDGSVTVPATSLAGILAKLPDAPITVEASGSGITLRSGKSEYVLLTVPAEDFPVVPEVTEGWSFSVTQADLKDLLKYTSFAAAKDASRSVLCSVLLEARADKLTAVCTDSHRLAAKTCALHWEQDAPDGLQSVIVPTPPLVELERLMPGSDEERVMVLVGKSQIRLEVAGVVLISRLMDGQYPNYEKVIPKKHDRVLTFDRSEILKALQRVNVVAKSESAKAVFDLKDGALAIAAKAQDVGTAYEELNCTLTGGPLVMAFNATYLMQVLSTVHGDKCTVALTNALAPGLLTVEGMEAFQYVLMPMQV